MSRLSSALFRNLNTVLISFDRYNRFGEVFGEEKSSAVVIQCLGQNSPHLQDLTVYPDGDSGHFVITWATIDAFKHMPLRRLRLRKTCMDCSFDQEGENDEHKALGDRSNDPNWKDFFASIPCLEVLELAGQCICPPYLGLLASSLPWLRLFVFGEVEFDDVKQPSAKANRRPATQPITLRGRIYFTPGEEDFVPDAEHISNVAMFVT
ncbi:hypothetical protein FRC07_009414, partial [Ceratobasidium sp. 392]